MKIYQKEIELGPYKRGFHIITNDIIKSLPEIKTINIGVLNLFLKHTSASLTINENASPDVRRDFESFMNYLIPEKFNYEHSLEGSDDMPAHLKASIFGASLTIPITKGTLNLGTWQGIYLCEHRNYGGKRELVITAYGL